MNEKPGFKTTEFWLSVAAMVVGAVIASGALEDAPSLVGQIVGIVATVLGALGYTINRSYVKAKTANAVAEIAKVKNPS